MIVDGYEPKKVKPISLDELEKYLWGAAVLLRGQIDATSYKEYIFPLVFFKRILLSMFSYSPAVSGKW